VIVFGLFVPVRFVPGEFAACCLCLLVFGLLFLYFGFEFETFSLVELRFPYIVFHFLFDVLLVEFADFLNLLFDGMGSEVVLVVVAVDHSCDEAEP
jgi:hypothetical protein